MKENTRILQADQAIAIMATFPWSNKSEWTWFGLSGLCVRAGRVAAKVELISMHVHGRHDVLAVKVFNQDGIVVDTENFFIEDFTDAAAPGARSDSRKDYTAGSFYVLKRDGQTSWYIAVPTPAALKKLVDAVETYVKTFEVSR